MSKKLPYVTPKQLLNIDQNAKTVKGQKKGYLTGILYLAPSDSSGVTNVCQFASKGCREGCLFKSGHGRWDSVQNSRINKTRYFHYEQKEFMRRLVEEIQLLVTIAKIKKLVPVVRLNGTSDIDWEEIKISPRSERNIYQRFPKVQFYDYTKDVERAKRYAQGEVPKNLHITFSRSENNESKVAEVVELKGNIAVVFKGKELPKTYMGLPVINGDEDDTRFNDGEGVVIGLKAKWPATKDESGFVVQV